MENNKPNCYACKYRDNVSGDAHSCCKHPKNAKAENALFQMLTILASVGRTGQIMADTGLNIRGNPHGIQKGFFLWPLNFDPIWLENCDGFEAKTENKKELVNEEMDNEN